jgi:hypothetical protein
MRKGFEYQSLLKKACAMLSRYVLEQIAPVIPLRRYESGCIEQQVKVVASPRNQRFTDVFRHRSCGCLLRLGCADRRYVSAAPAVEWPGGDLRWDTLAKNIMIMWKDKCPTFGVSR